MSSGYASGLHVLTAPDGNSRARVTGAYVLTAYTSYARQGFASGFFTLAAVTGQARQALLSGSATLAATLATGQNFPRMSAHFTVVAFDTGVPDKRRGRAWTYNFDGHSFYVLDLGEEGTWVYDFASGQWSRFDTAGYEGLWNARLGVYWAAQRKTVISDVVNSYLHVIDPEQPLDESWRPITYTVTAGIEARNRNFHTQESFRLYASVGAIADPLGATMTFRFSDDQARSWRATYTMFLQPSDDTQEIAFRSLGTIRAPGRIFEVTTSGGLIRIDSAGAEIEGWDNGK